MLLEQHGSFKIRKLKWCIGLNSVESKWNNESILN